MASRCAIFLFELLTLQRHRSESRQPRARRPVGRVAGAEERQGTGDRWTEGRDQSIEKTVHPSKYTAVFTSAVVQVWWC